jgi:hypothetical protein
MMARRAFFALSPSSGQCDTGSRMERPMLRTLILLSIFLIAGCQSMPGAGEAALSERGGYDPHSRALMDAAAILQGMERAHAETFADQRARP